MKKFFVMLAILAIAIAGVSAEARWTGTTLGENSKADVQVSLDLSGELGKYYQIGFSTGRVVDEADLSTLTPQTEIVLNQEQTNGEIQNEANTTYVYYAVQAPAGNKNNVSIGFSIAGNLTSSSDKEGIAWSATANGVTANVGADKKSICTVETNGELLVKSFPVTVSTEGLRTADYFAEKYTGNLVVTISAT